MGDEAMGRRFERDGRQCAAEIGFVETDQPPAGGGGVFAQPAEGELIRDGEQDERVRRDVPVADKLGEGESEIEGGVNGLTCLRPRRKVGPGDDVEAGAEALAVRHEHQCTCLVNCGSPMGPAGPRAARAGDAPQ
jgi:hypothetical protein